MHIWDDVENIRCPESGIHTGASIKHPLPPIAIRRGIFPHDINLLPSYKRPRLREKSSLCSLLTVPVWGPETLGSIEILGDTAPQTNTLHQALTACSLQSARQTFPQLLENRIAVPNVFQPIVSSVAEYKVRARSHQCRTAHTNRPREPQGCRICRTARTHPLGGRTSCSRDERPSDGCKTT